MRCLGLDFGTKTIGIAISDLTETIASSYTVLRYNEDYKTLFEEIKKIIEKLNIGTIVLGLPKNMNNTLGDRVNSTLEFKKDLENYLNMDIILEDERVTTKEANRVLIEADMSRKKRKGVVDSVAASFILQNYLDRKKKGN
jgi:putative Holliday junction resolvase